MNAVQPRRGSPVGAGKNARLCLPCGRIFRTHAPARCPLCDERTVPARGR
jgi:rubrerythrin